MHSARLTVRLFMLSAAALMAFAPRADAALIHNNFGLVSPAATITFEEIVLADQAELLNAYQALGVTFAPGMRYDTVNYGIPNSGGGKAANFFPFTNPFAVFFNAPTTAAAMIVATSELAPNSVITALLGGVPVESFAISTPQSGAINYFGFSNILFDQIQVSNALSGIVVDNIEYGTAAVPEPASLLMLISGFGMLGVRTARRRRS
jgi:hypothetical protein